MKNCWRTVCSFSICGFSIKNIAIIALGLALSPAAFAGYGAIAFSPSTYTVGESHGYWDLTGAENAAVNACGQADCRVMNWEQNRCNAFATDKSTGHWGRATGMLSSAEAVDAALQACGTANCVSRVWICG